MHVPDGCSLVGAHPPSRPRGNPVCFLDRDGTLTRDEAGYTYRTEDLELLPGAAAAIHLVNEAGFYTCVVTNQSGVARGYYTMTQVEAFHTELQRRLAVDGAWVDEFRVCPHHPAGRVPKLGIICACRKPEPGLLLPVLQRSDVDPRCCFMIGDKESDTSAAQNAGIRGYLCKPGELVRTARTGIEQSAVVL